MMRGVMADQRQICPVQSHQYVLDFVSAYLACSTALKERLMQEGDSSELLASSDR